MGSVFKTTRIGAVVLTILKLRGIGEHTNLQFEKERELLGLIKNFVKSKNAVRYFALMLVL